MNIRFVLVLAAVILGAAAPTASAYGRPHRYAVTYPVASSLCAGVAAATRPSA